MASNPQSIELPRYLTMEGDVLSVLSAISGLVDILGATMLTIEQINGGVKPKHTSPLGSVANGEAKTLKATLRLLQRCLKDRQQRPQRSAMIEIESLVLMLLHLVLVADELQSLSLRMGKEADQSQQIKTKIQFFDAYSSEMRPLIKCIHMSTLILSAVATILLSKSDKDAAFSANYIKAMCQRLRVASPALSLKMSRMDGLLDDVDGLRSIITCDQDTIRARMTDAASVAESSYSQSTVDAHSRLGLLGRIESGSSDRLISGQPSPASYSFDDELLHSTVYQRLEQEDMEYQPEIGTGVRLDTSLNLDNVPIPVTTAEISDASYYERKGTLRPVVDAAPGQPRWKRIFGGNKVVAEAAPQSSGHGQPATMYSNDPNQYIPTLGSRAITRPGGKTRFV